MPKNLLIGFIGQGFIGKNYADDFENRGYAVVRYAKEAPHDQNRDQIKDCDIVFIAVPTPTTPTGFNYDIVRKVIALTGTGKSVVIKSTILPGTCAALQKIYPDRFIFHSPEFLTEKNAAYDAAHPNRNIVGYSIENEEYRWRAEQIMSVLPTSPLNMICRDKEAEIVKYASNCFLFLKVIYANILYDLAAKEGSDWEKIKAGLGADPRIGAGHLNPIDASGHSNQPGRGCGGHCFIKDFSAFLSYAQTLNGDPLGEAFLKAAETKNLELLRQSEKDLDLLKEVYGE